MIQHIFQRIPEQLQISLRKAGVFRQRRGNIAMRPIQAVGNVCLPTHSPVVAALLVRLSSRFHSHAGDAGFQRHNRINALGKAELRWPPHLAAVVQRGGHHGPESPHVKEIGAHPFTGFNNLVRLVLHFFNHLISRFSVFGQHRFFFNIDAILHFISFLEFHEVADFPL